MSARRYRRRLRRGAAGTAVAAAAMAALTGSQAPGFLPGAQAASHERQQPGTVTPPPGPAIDGGSPYITELPPLNTAAGPLAPTGPGTAPAGAVPVAVPGGGASLPTTVLDAYLRAEAAVAQSDPGCHLPWQLLAAIGQVESGQARRGAVDANGTTFSPILGPVLDGNGFANISDTDGGVFDGDTLHDRAVGPMQFIPSTWQRWGADGNGDGASNPNNVYDAALAAAHYLCADGRDLAVPQDMDRAILGYNHSQAYLALVRAWYQHFRQGGAVAVNDRPGVTKPAAVSPAIAAPGSAGPSHAPSVPGAPASPPSGTVAGGGTAGGTTGPVSPPTPTPTIPLPGTPSPAPTTSPDQPPPPGTSPGTPAPSTSPTPSTSPPPTTTPTPSPTTTSPAPDCPSPTPTASGGVSPSPTASPTPTASSTPDPCATATSSPSATPSPSDTGAAVSGPAVTPTS